MRQSTRIRRLEMGVLCVLLLTCGCSLHHQKSWNSVSFLAPIQRTSGQILANSNADQQAEISYANGCELQAQGSPDCLDWFAYAAQQSWEQSLAITQGSSGSIRQKLLYDSAVGQLIESAQHFGRLDPANGIVLKSGEAIPIAYNEFVWQPTEISRLELVGNYKTPEGLNKYQQAGLGVPLLCHSRPQRKFTHQETSFVATAILRPNELGESGFVLELVNTLKTREIPCNGQLTPLAVDTTAPIGYLNRNADRLGINGLLNPNQSRAADGLRMITPYQPGKIPVIFIHGLASDPLTWGSMANDLFVNRDIIDGFQFWTFSYPTGAPFPIEAAKLRHQLVELRNHIDPEHRDAALDDIVLIGHSMGGLVSKMQITSSEDQLISSMSNVPLNQLQLQPDTRRQLSGLFQFSPSPQISRVIFIGTPHQGSNLAKGVANRLASRFIRQPEEFAEMFDEIRENNKRLMTTRMKKMPTSVDLLRPDNTLSQAIFRLPVSSRVSMHTIIGVGHGGQWGMEPSDGVVPYSSAKHPGVESELTVDAGHSLHNHPESTAEVVRILRLHANANIAEAFPTASTREQQAFAIPR